MILCYVMFMPSLSPGLSAAKLLHDGGHDVLVLEANDRVGGRTLNYYVSIKAIVYYLWI